MRMSRRENMLEKTRKVEEGSRVEELSLCRIL